MSYQKELLISVWGIKIKKEQHIPFMLVQMAQRPEAGKHQKGPFDMELS